MRDDAPEATVEPMARVWTFAWVVTAIAVVVGAVLVWQAWRVRSDVVFIRFDDANGLRTGDAVAYRGLHIGEVRRIALADDLESVVVHASLRPDAAGVAVKGSQWWIVRPEIGLQRVEGLDTLFGPRYLEVAPGPTDAPPQRRFEGLDQMPEMVRAEPGSLRLVLVTPRRGSIVMGSPVHYRDVPVGLVTGVELADDARSVRVRIAIEPEHAHLVRAESRFWKTGGIGLEWGIFDGFSFQTSSLEAVLRGGVAFATPPQADEEVENGTVFELAEEPQEEWLEQW